MASRSLQLRFEGLDPLRSSTSSLGTGLRKCRLDGSTVCVAYGVFPGAMARLAGVLHRFCAPLSASLRQSSVTQRVTGGAAEGRVPNLYSSMHHPRIILGNGDQALGADRLAWDDFLGAPAHHAITLVYRRIPTFDLDNHRYGSVIIFLPEKTISWVG